MKLFNLLSLVVISAVAANEISNEPIPQVIPSEVELNMDVNPGPPDYIGFVKAVRDDPIGFVNWRLELPIPDQYKVIAKPLIKSTVNNFKGRAAKIANKAIKEFRAKHKSNLSAAVDDLGTFFEGKEAKIEKIFEIVTKEIKKGEKYNDYVTAIQIFFEQLLSGEFLYLFADLEIELIKTHPQCGKAFFNSFISLQSDTKIVLPSIYKSYVSRVKKGIK